MRRAGIRDAPYSIGLRVLNPTSSAYLELARGTGWHFIDNVLRLGKDRHLGGPKI